MPIKADNTNEMMMDCKADFEAPCKSFSPTLRAIIAVAAVLNPIATEYTIVTIDSVYATTAMALCPSLPTKYMSTKAKTLSKLNSKIIGIANKNIACLILPCV